MSIETLNPGLEAAHRLSGDWFEGDEMPLPDARTAQYQLDWKQTPKNIRERIIGEAKKIADWRERVAVLFVLWTWEPESELRAQIVTALPLDSQVEVLKVLRMIFRHETPDGGGGAVRKCAKERLTQMAAAEKSTSPVRTRGAVRTRGGGGHLENRTSAREILSELEELESTNRPAVRTR